jgi:glucosamine-6-phosphate deaminase
MVPFQGSDSREFWQRAEERNADTANLFADLGLTHYAAMEAFVRWHY